MNAMKPDAVGVDPDSENLQFPMRWLAMFGALRARRVVLPVSVIAQPHMADLAGFI